MDTYFKNFLINKIIDKAKKKTESFLIEARKYEPSDKWGKYIYDTLFEKDLAVICSIPDYWFIHYNHIKISCFANSKRNFLFGFNLGSFYPFPVKFNSDLAEQDTDHYYVFELKDHPVWKDFMEELNIYDKAIDQAIKLREEFVTLVSKLCNSCNTLKQALEVWPPLWNLLPDDIIEKYQNLKLRKQPRKSKEIIPDVDIERLTTLMAIVRLKICED